MSLIEDCLTHIEEVVQLRAVSGMAYPRAQAAVGVLRSNIKRIQVLSQAAFWGEPRSAIRLREILHIAVNGQPIEQLIEASSLGEPLVKAARESVDPNLVKQVIRRSQELEEHPTCPACLQGFRSPDHDPFCSSCVEAGWDIAWARGYAAKKVENLQ